MQRGNKKTGTTIVGLKYKGGIILASDTRATAGSLVMDKECVKLHKITPNIYCAGAGTAADNDHVMRMVASQVRLLELNMNRTPRVDTICVRLKRHLFQYQGHVGAHVILGGVDFLGSHLYSVSNYGNASSEDFVVNGSGSYAAMSVFEAKFRDGLEEEEAAQIATEAIRAGIINDEGSGFYVNLVIIRKKPLAPYGEVEERYHVERPAPRQEKIEGLFTIKKGTTEVMREIVLELATKRETITKDEPHNTPIEPVGILP
ncbi:MAG: putative Proteasome subunit beta type-7 [Streblomastix strix]|uniref:Proteasome subunit beta n=1 Tax=Streblomastix strix TaxID=222440 RepID=A0A5J4XAM1_9EUKA|nr:MAG: putative Proteasome subunit beta type-7 [Streblomastix strix]